jgi:hypothetical protein
MGHGSFKPRGQAKALPIGVGQLLHYLLFDRVGIESLTVKCKDRRVFDHVLHVSKLVESRSD